MKIGGRHDGIADCLCYQAVGARRKHDSERPSNSMGRRGRLPSTRPRGDAPRSFGKGAFVMRAQIMPKTSQQHHADKIDVDDSHVLGFMGQEIGERDQKLVRAEW